MQRYGGELIYHGRDDMGVLEVVDSHGVRSLHFGTPPRQSAMSLNDPARLELAYARAMLSSLLLVPQPQRALLVGLGGGSLARFLLAHFPACHLVAVERRARVVEIAHEYFDLPRDDRLDIHVAEASHLLEYFAVQCRREFDLILVDAYDHLGMDSSINAPDFFVNCTRLLRPVGVLSINLWGSHPVTFKKAIALLKTCFSERTLRLAVPNRGNVIALGLGESVAPFKRGPLENRALALEFRTGLELGYFLRNLRPIH